MKSSDFETFDEFQQNLELKCERGKPARFTFKPDKNTPDLLYYQCYTHRHLGWRIHVVDSCDGLRHEASIQHVKNVTYNSLASDYKRGGEKKKLFSEDEEEYQYPRNDGIPLILEDSSETTELQNERHYTPQTYIPTTESEKSTVFFKMPTSSQEKKTYFITTQHPKTLSKYSTPRPVKVVTMETFQLKDVVPSFRQRGNYHHNRAVSHSPRNHYAPQQHRPQFTEMKNTLQWWNDPSKSQVAPTPTASTLRQQLAILNSQQRPNTDNIQQRHPSQRPNTDNIQQRHPSQRPNTDNIQQRYPSQRPQNTQNKVISVVINNDRYQSQASFTRTYILWCQY
ncbi:hypothetical protein CEXT_170351 [Caerostris extrusa]|uniref:At5g54830-like domain-containing protein n=1 Tax=Caerostris extrusa TaxID=172846 RepID=A0AAV4M7J3_CAEEX|nr:hypothetical protein CEXT_170351 [Caerostris extrusa]